MKKSTKFTFIIIFINLLIAATIIVTMFGDFHDLFTIITDWSLNLLIGIGTLFLSGYYISLIMERLIIQRKFYSLPTGIIGLLIILLIGTFFGSTVGFLNDGLVNMYSEQKITDVIFDYYCKPFFWIFFFGIIPTIITGGTLGYLIKKYQ